MSDDQGYGDLASYGAPYLKTPNIDGIGERGMRFTQHYAGSPLCTPSRAALLTGAWPPRVNMPNVLNPLQPQGMPQQETLLPEYLKTAGYATGHFGKWHLGDPAANPAHHPMNHGFDRWYGTPYSNDYPTVPVYDDHTIVQTIVYPGALTQDAGNGDEQNWLNKSIFDHAIEWIGEQREQPFFAYVAPSQPHEPVASEFQGSAGGPHGSSIEEMDHLVGRIIEQLDRLGVRDNTCIVFTSDNGPWWVGDTAGLYGRKGETYEGGIRVPFVMEWPAMMRRNGRVYDGVTSHIDVLPTFCAAAGVPLRQDRVIDGQNILAGHPNRPGDRPRRHRVLPGGHAQRAPPRRLEAARAPSGQRASTLHRTRRLVRHSRNAPAVRPQPRPRGVLRPLRALSRTSSRRLQARLDAFDAALKADRAARYPTAT